MWGVGCATRLIVTISWYIHVSSHYVVHLKQTQCYVTIIYQKTLWTLTENILLAGRRQAGRPARKLCWQSWRNEDTWTKWGFGDGGRWSDWLCLTLEPTRLPAESMSTVTERRSQGELQGFWPDQLRDKAMVSLQGEGCKRKWHRFHFGQVEFDVPNRHLMGRSLGSQALEKGVTTRTVDRSHDSAHWWGKRLKVRPWVPCASQCHPCFVVTEHWAWIRYCGDWAPGVTMAGGH